MIILTTKQKQRINNFWDIHQMHGLLTSNIPRHYIENQLLKILSVKDDNEFLQRSKEINILNEETLIRVLKNELRKNKIKNILNNEKF